MPHTVMPMRVSHTSFGFLLQCKWTTIRSCLDPFLFLRLDWRRALKICRLLGHQKKPGFMSAVVRIIKEAERTSFLEDALRRERSPVPAASIRVRAMRVIQTWVVLRCAW
jgi:hypothetical protein